MRPFFTFAIFFSLLFSVSSFHSFAQSNFFVVDKTTAKQAGANGASATAKESLIDSEFDRMQKEQNKVQTMVLVIEQHLSKVEKIQKDVSAFKKEGAAIRLFVFKTKKALGELQNLRKSLSGRELGIVASSQLITDLSVDIYGICSSLVSTVIDSKFALPGLSQPKPYQELNLLEPQERLAFFDHCCYQMDLIVFKIQQMQFSILSSNSLNDVFLKLAPKSYWTVEYGKIVANDIVSLWKD